jgi:hypothetical protein
MLRPSRSHTIVINHEFIDEGTENRLPVATYVVNNVRRDYSRNKCRMQLTLDSNKDQVFDILRIIFEFCSITELIRQQLSEQTSVSQ